MPNSLRELTENGVAVWLDDLSRARLDSGNLAQLRDEYHVVGVTSNPTIFAKAVSSGDDYDAQLRELASGGASADEAARAITTRDVRDACDVLRSVYDATDGVDGRVSLEVDPRLARDTEGTIAEAATLWHTVARENLFIKIPATAEGLPAITETLGSGISVNVTLIFGLDRYSQVIDAFFSGLEKAQANGHSLRSLGSVASFFVSRVDTEVDKRLDSLGLDGPAMAEAQRLRGMAAIANARLAYQRFEEQFSSSRWTALRASGAKPQRPLWASTSTKDPSYPDTRYVTELIAPHTVNTMPESTLLATADHGEIRGNTIAGTYDASAKVLSDLAELGIDYIDVVTTLENEGVDKFAKSWEELLESVRENLAT